MSKTFMRIAAMATALALICVATTQARTQKIIETVNITGMVKDKDGNPLEHADISMNGKMLTQTDAAGRFSFEADIPNVAYTFTLFFSYDGLVTAVRSYHAAMQNTFFDVTLFPPTECCIRTDCFISPVTAIEYRTKGTEVTEEMSGLLLPLVDSLKEHPFCNLRFTAYAIGEKPGSRAAERLRLIQEFFASHGITEKRIIQTQNNSKVSDSIDVEAVKEQ